GHDRPVTADRALLADPAGAAVGVVGAGTMGAGIAQVAALAGHPVLLLDAEPGNAAAAADRIRSTLLRLAERGHVPAADAESAARRLSAVTGVDELDPCDLVVEAVVERLDVKQDVLAALEAV